MFDSKLSGITDYLSNWSWIILNHSHVSIPIPCKTNLSKLCHHSKYYLKILPRLISNSIVLGIEMTGRVLKYFPALPGQYFCTPNPGPTVTLTVLLYSVSQGWKFSGASLLSRGKYFSSIWVTRVWGVGGYMGISIFWFLLDILRDVF